MYQTLVVVAVCTLPGVLLADEKLTLVDRLGDPLPPGAVARLGTSRFRPAGIVRALTWSPDGKLLASGVDHGGVFLWDGDTGRLHSTLWGKEFGAYALAFSPDGKLLAAPSSNGETLHVWDLAQNKQVSAFLLPINAERERALGWSVAFSPGGKMLACGDFNGTLSVWNVTTGQLTLRTRQGTTPIHTVAFLSGGKVLAAYGGTDIVLRDAATGKESKRITVGAAQHLVISPDEKLAAYGPLGESGSPVGLYDLEAGKTLPPIKGNEPAHSLAFLPDSKHLVVTHAGAPQGGLRLWDVVARKEVRRFEGLEHGIHPGSFLLAISPDGKKLAGGVLGHNGLRVWDIATGKRLSPTGYMAGMPAILAFTTDGKAVASLEQGHLDMVKVWNAVTGEPIVHPVLSNSVAWYGLKFAPQDKTLLVSQVTHWSALDMATGKVRGRFEGQLIAISPDGKWLAAARHKLDERQRRYDATVWLHHAVTGKAVRELEKLDGVEAKDTGVEGLSFSTDGKTLTAAVKGEKELSVRVWDPVTGKTLHDVTRLPRNKKRYLRMAVRALAPDGKVLALSTHLRDHLHEVVICDLASGSVTPSFPAQLNISVSNQIAFSPDGRTIAVTQDGRIRLYESVSGLERVRFESPRREEHVTCLTIAPDGRTLAAGYYHDTVALVWDVTARLLKGKLAEAEVTAARLEELWKDLGDDRDGARAHRAVWELVAAPKQSIPFLKDRLRLPRVDQEQTAKWIADLEDKRFLVRSTALRSLEEMWIDAEPSLRRALGTGPDVGLSLEKRRRLEGLLDSLDGQTPPKSWLRALRSIEVLEQVGSEPAVELLERMAGGGSTSRLARSVEKSLVRLRLKQAR